LSHDKVVSTAKEAEFKLAGIKLGRVISDGHQYEIEVRTDLADLERVSGLLDEIWRAHDLPFEIQADLNISVEEILSNVIRHGGASQPIQMRVVVRPENVTIEILDRGASFDPLNQAPQAGSPAADVQLLVQHCT
jgi:anti-sigma regulatory factor (Ser/Thr protein kinase)